MTAHTNFLIERIRCQALASKQLPNYRSQKILIIGYLMALLEQELITDEEMQREIRETDQIAELFDP